MSAKSRRRLMGQLYQVAGALTLSDDELTEGQRLRLRELLLDALSDPDRWTAKAVRIKYDLALR